MIRHLWILLSLAICGSIHAQVASNTVSIGNVVYPSIQAAANAAKQGETIVIGPGVYRETIRVTTPNLTFVGSPGAIISGLEPINGTWTTHSGSIRKINLPEVTQLFADGEMLIEARWPKISSKNDFFEKAKMRKINASTSNTITDSGIPGGVVGAKIWMTGWYLSLTGTITSQNGSTITSSRPVSPEGHRKYFYLKGTLSLLTQPGEWVYQNGTLYYWPTGSNFMEYKVRRTGFDIRGTANTTIKGLQFIGCDPVVGDVASSNTVVDGIKAKYTNHLFDVTPTDEPGLSGAMAVSYYNARLSGIKLIGPNSEIRNSELDWVSSQAIWLGQGCRAINNMITNVGYEGNYGCGFMMWEGTNRQKVLYNTVRVSGRSAVDFGWVLNDDKTNMEIAYNDFSGYGCLNIDVGGIYTGGFKVTTNTSIHHNWIHDGRAEFGDGVNCAVYYDMGSGPALVHHNVFWGNINDAFVNSNFEHRSGVVGEWYNNTFATPTVRGLYHQSYKSVTTRDIHRNNIYRNYVTLNLDQWQVDVKNSIMMSVDPQFVGTGNGGLAYQLRSTSPAINAGMVISGITDSPTPDAGAYEYGTTPWVPGYVPVSTVDPPTPNVAPTVTLTAPAINAQFPAGSNIALTATATDSDGTVSKVEFYNGTTKLGEDTTSPYTFAWNNVAAGTYTLTARATDNQNATKTSNSVTITVSNSNIPPTVTITSPANNANYTVGENLTITVSAADNDGTVSKVEFYNGTTKLGEDSSNPYSFTWTNLPEGTFTLTAKAFDNQNATTTSSAIRITVSRPNAVPTVVLTGPTNNASVQAGSNVTLSATASDTDGTVNKVEFFSGNNKLGEDTTSPYTFVWSNVPAGTHTLTARATDNLNAVAISAAVGMTAIAPNILPTVSITSPTNNASAQAGSNITISANANDSDGTIARVEFYSGTTKIGEDTTSPYSYVWQNVAVGTYTLTARAIDNLGGAKTSAPITVNVVMNTPPVVIVTAPADNAQFTAGDNVTITATATDSDGTVTRVEFYEGAIKLGEDLTNPYNFLWRNVPPGTYHITAKVTDNRNATATSSSIKIDVLVATPPTVSAGPDVFLTSPDVSASLTATGKATDGSTPNFSWAQVSGPNQAIFSNPNQASITVSGLIEGEYEFEVTATDNRALTNKDIVRVVLGGEVISEGLIPRFFTPNDDGVNDFWEWPHTELLDNALLMIFNRLGQKVYEALPYDNTWDGKSQGKPLEADAYYYIIRLLNQTDIKGAVRIIR